jgi:glucokinase
VGEPHTIALDLGGTKLAVGTVDRSGLVLRRVEHATEQSSQEALVEQLEAAIDELRDGDEVALGVGIPSLIDQRTGRAGSSVNVTLAEFDLRDRLEERFGLPVALENDANCAAVAEHRLGAGRGTRHLVLLTLGTGIGGGLILNGELYRGSIGAAGELGHMTIKFDGPACQGYCNGFGHLETFASGTRARARAEQIAAERPDGALARAQAEGRELKGRVVVELARAGEPDALEVLTEIGRLLGVGIASYVNIFNPEVVVVGGGFGEAGDLLLEPARAAVAELALPPSRDVVRIVEAELGPRAGLVGAGLVAWDLAGTARG